MKTKARLLRHPVRMKVIEQLRLRGSASISELANDVGESTHALHYHFKILLESGLIAFVGKRAAHHRGEAIYSLAESHFKLSCVDNRSESPEALLAFAIVALELAKSELSDASTGDEIRNVAFARWVGNLSTAQVQRVNSLLAEIRAEFAAPKGETAFSFTVGLVPKSPRYGD